MPRNLSTLEPKTKKRKTEKEKKRKPGCWSEASALKFCFIRIGSSSVGTLKLELDVIRGKFVKFLKAVVNAM